MHTTKRSNNDPRWHRFALSAAISATVVALSGATALAQPLVAGRLTPAPVVLSARAAPGALPAKGGTVEVMGEVRGATLCRLAVLGDHGVKVTLPKPADCASGTYREPVNFGPNHTKSAVVVKLGLFAGPERGAFYVVVGKAPSRPSTVLTGPTMRYAKQAEVDATTYTDDVWCGALQEASGHSLAVLENDVKAGINQVASLSTPNMVVSLTPKFGQIFVTRTAKPSKTDMATADAIVPAGVNPRSTTLHTAYCFVDVQPLTGYQVTAKGGAGIVLMETAYKLVAGGHTMWWHLWWQWAPSYVGCGQTICLNDWTTPRSPLIYWAVPQRSTGPEFVVPGMNGAWQLSYPPS